MALGNMFWLHYPNSDKHIMFVNMDINDSTIRIFMDQIYKLLCTEIDNDLLFNDKMYTLYTLSRREDYISFSEALLCEWLHHRNIEVKRKLPKLKDINYINCYFETDTTTPFILFATSQAIPEMETLFQLASKRTVPFNFQDFKNIFIELKVISAYVLNINKLHEYVTKKYGNLSISSITKKWDYYITSDLLDKNILPSSDNIKIESHDIYSFTIEAALRMDALQDLLTVKNITSLSKNIYSVIETNWLNLHNLLQTDQDSEGNIGNHTSFYADSSHFTKEKYFVKVVISLTNSNSFCIILECDSTIINSNMDLFNILNSYVTNGIIQGVNCMFSVATITDMSIEDFVKVPDSITIQELCIDIPNIPTNSHASEILVYKIVK